MKHQNLRTNTAPLPPPAPRAKWWQHALILLALLAVTLGLYGRTVTLGFLALDDPEYVQNNPFIGDLNTANIRHILSTPYFANYAPGHLFSYALDVALAGAKSASAMHFSNVIWYGWVVCMVYLLAFGLRANLLVASGAALLFAAHPAHVEVVAWISSRKDLVATGFALLAMACYLRYHRAVPGRVWWYVASLTSFLLASSAKQSVILLPAVMLLWDFLFERRRGWLMLADKLPFGLITLFFGWMNWQAQPSTGQAPNFYVLAVTELTNFSLLSGFADYVMYRSSPDASSVSILARVAVVAAGALAWTVPLLLLRLRYSLLAAAFSWILLNMVPPMVMSFMTPITDRYLFLPSVGVCILMVEAAFLIASRYQMLRLPVWSALAVVAGVWSWSTSQYVAAWADPRSVWYYVAPRVQTAPPSQYCGDVFQEAGDRLDRFLKSGQLPSMANDLRLAQAVLQDPERANGLHLEWTGGAAERTNTIAYRDQLWSLAWDQYEQAVARRGNLNLPTLFMRRGMILINRGRPEEALNEFQVGLQMAQTFTYPMLRLEYLTHLQRALGIAYWNLRRFPEAREWLLQAQTSQRQSGRSWIPTLDEEVRRITQLARETPAGGSASQPGTGGLQR